MWENAFSFSPQLQQDDIYFIVVTVLYVSSSGDGTDVTNSNKTKKKCINIYIHKQ
jgi:hypothetical protein